MTTRERRPPPAHASARTRQDAKPASSSEEGGIDQLVALLGASLGFSIRRAQIRAYEIYFRTVGEAGLTPARMTALAMIGEGRSVSQIEVAERLKISGPSMVKVIDALESLGLVAREPHPSDRRRYALVLTADGEARLARIRELVQVFEDQIASRLSDRERTQLLRLLEKVALDP